MTELLNSTDFNKFKDDSWGVVLDVHRFLTKYGIYKGDAFQKWFENIVKEKTGDEKTTFKEVYERYNKELVITGTCLNRSQTYYFHYSTYPDMPISLAIRISMSYPFFFKAVVLDREEITYDKDGNIVYDKDGIPQTQIFKDVMIDGGLLNNYPIWVFDGESIGDHLLSEETMKQSKTLGFKLMSSAEKKDDQLYYQYEEINDILDYFKTFINSMSVQIERGHIRTGYWDKTVCIDTKEVQSMDFDITEEKKEELIKSGYNSTKNHFRCLVKDIPNIWNRLIK